MCLSVLITSIDALILNVALPTLVRDLDASTAELQWIVDAYILVFAGFLLVGGSLGDRFGRSMKITSTAPRITQSRFTWVPSTSTALVPD